MLEKGKGNHRHECMMVQAPPTATLEVIEADLLLHLLVHLLADPAALDQRRQALQRDILRMVAHPVCRAAAARRPTRRLSRASRHRPA